MDYNKLRELWEEEEKKSFKGWDFSYLENRWEHEELPWEYKDILLENLKPEYKLLDMCTGGGEFLLSLKHPYNNTAVTEMWEPNVKLCKERLEPLGIEVKQVFNDDELPFEDNNFDVIINRHGAFNVKEVKRILNPGGVFITQQVGGRNNEILSKGLMKNFRAQFPENTLDNALRELTENSFDISHSKEYFPYLRFKDMGAVVYYAKVIEWEFPKFSVDNCFEELCKLNEVLILRGYVESLEHRYIIMCRKGN